MISASVRSLFSIVAALAFTSYVLCNPLPSNPFSIIDRSHTDLNGNFSAERRLTSVRHFPVTEDDTDRIVGGQYARTNQFPFMAVVHRLMGKGMVSQCGGTIISHRWVLTAGHCVASGPHQFFLIFGTTDKSGVGYNFYHGSGISMMSYKGVLHPDYKPTINDIGLIYLPQNLPFSESIQPIQLAGHNDMRETFTDKTATVIGWGKDGNYGTGTTKLKYATLPVISNNVCGLSWGVTSKHVCTAADYGQDACQGDSGGPLVVYENGMPLQIGIVSYGDANCPSNKPGVFTRVTGHIPWIEQVVGQYF